MTFLVFSGIIALFLLIVPSIPHRFLPCLFFFNWSRVDLQCFRLQQSDSNICVCVYIYSLSCYSALFIYFLLFVFGCIMGHVGFSSVTRDQIHCPLQWKYGVLTTGLPGKSHCLPFNSTAICLPSPWQRDLPAHWSVPFPGLLTTFFPFYFYQCCLSFYCDKIIPNGKFIFRSFLSIQFSSIKYIHLLGNKSLENFHSANQNSVPIK